AWGLRFQLKPRCHRGGLQEECRFAPCSAPDAQASSGPGLRPAADPLLFCVRALGQASPATGSMSPPTVSGEGGGRTHPPPQPAPEPTSLSGVEVPAWASTTAAAR